MARTYPEEGLQTIASLDNFKAKSVDFTYRFGEELNDFREALGISRLLPVQNGMTVYLYGAPEVTLADGTVEEGAIIPLSSVDPVAIDSKVIELKKYRKATSGEAIQRYGLDQAIDYTDTALIKEVQKDIRADLFTMVQAGNAQDNLSEAFGLQGALASAWGALQTVFDDDTVKVIVFAHPMDLAQAIADKELTLETAFGLNYYEAATGTAVFATTQVKKGSIYATAAENLVVAYIPAGNSDLGRAFNLTADSTGFIGMTHFVQEESLTQQTLVVSGVNIFPERLDGVVKVALADAVGG